MVDVVIIGGGVIGSSIAYFLAKNGVTDVTIYEKGTVGCGSTSKCTGGIRQQFSNKINIKLSQESVRFFENFEENTGSPADFRQNGYLILARSNEELTILKKNLLLQHQLGVPVRLLSPKEAVEIIPQLNHSAFIAANYCPTDGFADPYSTVQGFLRAARGRGIKLYEGVEVVGIKTSRSRIAGVHLSDGTYTTAQVVVNAAGPYVRELSSMVGVEVPIRPSRRHVFIGCNHCGILPGAPLVADLKTGFWFRREGSRLLFGMRNPDEPESYNCEVDWDWLAKVGNVACQLSPIFESLGLERAWAGLHSDTRDYNAILEETPEVEGFILACGFSGHGFQHAPAIGRLVSEHITGKIELRELNLTRDRFLNHLPEGEKFFI